MALLELVEAPWEELEDRLLEEAVSPCRQDPFTERWVIVPSALLREHLRLLIAAREHGIAGLRFLFPGAAADQVLLRSGSSRDAVLTPLARDLLVLRALERRRAEVSELTGSEALPPSLTEAVLRTVGDLREAGVEVEEVERLAGGGRGSEGKRIRLVRGVYSDYLTALDGTALTDPEGRYLAAADTIQRSGPDVLPDAVWIYGFYDAKAGQTALFRSLCEATDVRMLVPFYHETEAYAAGYLDQWRSRALAHVRLEEREGRSRRAITLPDLRERLAKGREGLTGEGGLVAVVSAPGRGREVDQALRLQAAAWKGGLRRSETVVATPAPLRYERLCAEEGAVNGIPPPGRVPATVRQGGPDEIDRARGIARFLALLVRVGGREVDGSVPAAACELGAALTGGAEASGLGATPVRRMEGRHDLEGWRQALERQAARELERAERLSSEDGGGNATGDAGNGDGEGEGENGGLRSRATTRIRRHRERARAMDAAEHLLSRLAEVIAGWDARANWEEWADRLTDLLEAFGIGNDGEEAGGRVIDEIRALSPLPEDADSDTVLWALARIEGATSGSANGSLPAIMEIRGIRAPLLLVLGMAEGTWPGRPTPDPLLPDHERRTLSGDRAWLLPTTAHRALEECLLFRLMLEAGACTVFLYPRLEEDGTIRRASPHVAELLLDLEAGEYADLEQAARSGTRALGDALPAPGEMLLGEGDRDLAAVGTLLGRGEEEAATVLWTSEWFRAGWRAETARWRSGNGAWTGILEDAGVVELARDRLFEGPDAGVSASLLENYARCPWRVFTLRVLNLPEQRDEPEGLLDPMESGAILHEVLRAHVEERMSEGAWPPDPDGLAREEALLQECLAREVGFRYARRPGRMPSLERAEVRRGMDRLTGWLRWEAGAVPASGDEQSGPPLEAGSAVGWSAWATEHAFEATLDAGRRKIVLRGRWDRVDRDASGRHRLVDYKTGRSRLPEADEVRGGTHVQMPLYVLAAPRVLEEGEVAGGLLLRFGSEHPGAGPQVVPISAALLSGGEAHLLTLVDLLTEGMEKGVYVRWPHPKEADNRSGLCKGCPTPAICRGWPEAETLRFADHEKMRLLHIARAIDALEGDE